MEDMVVDLYKEERKKKFGASWLVVLCFRISSVCVEKCDFVSNYLVSQVRTSTVIAIVIVIVTFLQVNSSQVPVAKSQIAALREEWVVG